MIQNKLRAAANIKLFVCCHQPSSVPKHPLLNPIQTGAALADTRFPGFFYDDTGENISKKNRSYCELTAEYWAWKNVDADYYGFFHYRRYLYPDVKARCPYRVEKEPTLALLNDLGYETFTNLIQQYDVILPKGENMYIPVREHYATAPFHHRKDLALVEEILRDRYPEMIGQLDEYFSGTICYFGNIFIMKRRVFYDYCAWIFSVLEEFDRRANISDYGSQERRVNGYLAERLLGVWIRFKQSKGIELLELPKVHFCGREILSKRLLNTLLPPGSLRRATVKRFRK